MTSYPTTEVTAAPAASRRADIQGLRGLAVLLVVWFHTGSGPTGGFLGVDVFFVISGYVITRGLAARVDTGGSAGWGDFVRRRIRRLLPAMATMTVVVTVATVLLLSPFGAQQRALRTGGAATVFVANVELYRTTGYFDRSAALNPFLHTWSLSVEEQFFVLLPLLMAFAVWWGRRSGAWRRSAVLLVAALSVLSAAAALVATSGADLAVEAPARLAFFAMPTRLWEFGAGVLLALVVPVLRRRRWSDVAGVVGVMAILASAAVVGAGDPHPGPWTVVVVAATVAVLAAGSAGGPASAVLAWAPLRRLGDVSYGWYLWHWPLLVFAALWWPTSAPALWAAAVVALVPAWASHRFLEQPVRTSDWWTPRRTWALGALCVLVPLCVLVGADRLARTGLGVSEPIDWYDYPPSQGTACHTLNRDLPVAVDPAECRFGPADADQRVLVLGDELANGVVPAVLDAAAARGLATEQRTRAGCPFVLGVVPAGHPRCAEWQDAVMSELRADPPAAVVLASQASRYLIGGSTPGVADNLGAAAEPTVDSEEWADRLDETVQQLRRLDVPVLVVGPVPDYGVTFPRDVTSVLRPSIPVPTLDRAEMERRTGPSWRATRERLGAVDGVAFIDPLVRLCDRSSCSAVLDGRWTHLGPVDLTARGARRLRGDLDRALEDVIDR